MTSEKMINSWHMKGLNRNQLKFIAAFSMMLDHIGYELLYDDALFRIIGRLAFPIFSFFIYEGFVHTKSRFRYFFRVLILGLICMIVYYMFSGKIYGNVLITFSCSILILSSVHYLKKCITSRKKIMIGLFSLVSSLVGVTILCDCIYVDYGIIGVLLPVFPLMFHNVLTKISSFYLKQIVTTLLFSLGLLLLSVNIGGTQYFSLLSVPFLFAYNGQCGTLQMKAFFYWFYPVHLAIIGLLKMFIDIH